MSNETEVRETTTTDHPTIAEVKTVANQAPTCGCGCSSTQERLVFAIGQLGYDFGTEARRDSIMQHMKPANKHPPNPYDVRQISAYLDENPWEAGSIIWTLILDATPIYAVQPYGSFGREIGERLRRFLNEQYSEGVERVSIPGWTVGSARLLSGQVVPLIHPTLRGMYSWTTRALVETILGKSPAADAGQKDAEGQRQHARAALENFLKRVYDQLRNRGDTPQLRAMNYSATNALLVAGVFEDALKEEMNLDDIQVEPSPICRPGSECWDVKLTFFHPKKILEVGRKVYRFTVDASDVVPVMVGAVRSWSVR